MKKLPLGGDITLYFGLRENSKNTIKSTKIVENTII